MSMVRVYLLDVSFVSDSLELGPYIYRFDKRGKMVDAIRPNDALIPFRNGTERYVHYTYTILNL